jgi:hypothetical protein
MGTGIKVYYIPIQKNELENYHKNPVMEQWETEW